VDFATRLQSAAKDSHLSQASLAKEIGLSRATLQRYWVGERLPPGDTLIDIAEAVGASAAWLIRGETRRSNVLVDAAHADWVDLPEYALLEIDEQGKMDPIASIKIWRDWLYSSLGEASDLWLTRLPAPYDALSIGSGVPLICKDHRPGERPFNGSRYLFWYNGGIVMGRFALRDGDGDDDELIVGQQDIGRDDDQYQIVARVVGQLARPF
jgi:transcriptional regulator with XRE-family HTH domain